MPTYKATLTSKGNVNNTYIYLEILPSTTDPAPIPVFLKAKGLNLKSWSNNNIGIDVVGKLDYELRVHAFHGTEWEFGLVNKSNNKTVIGLKGQTGEDTSIGFNISVRKGSVDPNGNYET